jgi:hypothetical protein
MNKEPLEETVETQIIVHGDPLTEATAFPTHTHGLSGIGMPEFFMDPVAFGAEGNAARISAACRHMSQPENVHELEAVLNGEVIKIRGVDLDRDAVDGHTYCFREVPHEFEGVKLAYSDEIGIEDMRFVQIWVEGDDYALEDDYYKGGVRW